MALTDKDILITPNDGSSTADPKTEFTGADSSGSDTITLETQYDGSITTLSFEGSAGQLFSISNDLTGTIFAVNDNSGIPSIEVDNDGEIRLAEFSGNVGIGVSAPAQRLHVKGTILRLDGTQFELRDSSGNFKAALNDNGAYTTLYADGNGSYPYITFNGADVSIGHGTSGQAKALQLFVGSADVATDNTGLTLTMDGTYSDGRYEHRFRKRDEGGGIPLYIDYTTGTANSHTALVRFGEYTNNSDKFEVYGGAKVSGNLTVTGTGNFSGDVNFEGGILQYDASSNSLDFQDNIYAQFGTGNDLRIYHNGTDSYIQEAGTGNLNIKGNGSFINFLDNSNNLMAYMVPGGAVGLYHNTSKKFETTSTGATVTGSLAVTGDLNITGDINTTSVSNLDVVDKVITIGKGGTASGNTDGGIIVDGANAKLTWNNSNGYWQMNKKLAFNDTPTTTNQALGIIWSGFDKEGTTDFSDSAKIIHTTNTGGHAGSVLLLESQNDSGDGIAFYTHGSSHLKHNSNNIWTAGNDGSGSGLDADTLDGINSGSFLRSDANDTATGAITLSNSANQFNGHHYFTAYDANGNHYPHYEDGSSQNGTQVNTRLRNSSQGFDVFYMASGDNNITWRGNRLWTVGNDGSGSGLDADLLDGIQASGFHNVTSSPSTAGNGNLSIGYDGSTYSYVQSHGSKPLRLNPVGNAVQIGSGNTVWHAGNDGSGSGLDADTLDGVNSGSFLRSDATDTSSGKLSFGFQVSNLNSVSGSQGVTPFRAGYQASNRPGTGNYFTGAEYTFHDSGARAQLGFGSSGNNTIPHLYARTEGWSGSDGWHSWYLFWHSGNDGSGSGLDADTLDGINSGSFLRSDTSDQLDGTLTIQSGGTNSYGRIRGYANDNHFIVIRGAVANSSTLSITGSHQTTFVEHANDANEGWYFKSKTTGSYRELARIDGLGDMYLEGNQRVFADNYHPNADKLTTARTIAGTSFDGTANIDISYDNLTNKPSNISNSDTVDGLHASSFLRSDATDTASGTLSLNGRVNIGNSVTRPAALNSDSVAQARIGGSDVYLYVASLNSTGGYKLAMQAARASDFASFTMNLQSNGGSLQRAGNTVWDAGNDGSGSGLDADVLDGIQASSFLRSDANDTATGVITFAATPTLGGTSSNEGGEIHFGAPTGGVHSSFALDNYQGHFRVHTLQSGKEFRIHSASSGLTTIGSNIGTVWGSGNDGAGSGLDADTVDGIQGGNFLRTDTNDSLFSGNATLQFENQSSFARIAFYKLSLWEWNVGEQLVIDGGNFNVTSSTFTKSGSTVWHAGNDGSGSGLDADTLDGIQASKFLSENGNGTGDFRYNPGGSSADVKIGHEITTNVGSAYIRIAKQTGYGASGMIRFYLSPTNTTNTDSSSTYNKFTFESDGDLHADGDVIAFSTFTGSDRKLKENIRDLEGSLDKTLKLRGVKYDWKAENKANDQLGFIAQEVEEVLPELVSEVETLTKEGETHLTVNYPAVVPVLVEAIKEQQTIINRLEERLTNLENKIGEK